MIRTNSSGGSLINILKTLVFIIIIMGGLFALFVDPPENKTEHLLSAFPLGLSGLISAMGYSFIALQGFDLIAAVGGEIKGPEKNLPRSMFCALGISFLIYLPLLLLVLMVGVPQGVDVISFSAENPDTVVARAVKNFMGNFGFWLVLFAGVLSMYSAMVANIFAASRIAQTMARDRTLPFILEKSHQLSGAPYVALLITAIISCIVMVGVSDVGSAGAVSSLIFLITFSFAHIMCLLMRK